MGTVHNKSSVIKTSPTAEMSHVDSIVHDDEIKKEEELRYTLSPWYVPDSLDAHGEWTDPKEVQHAFWKYLAQDDRNIRLQHNLDIVAGKWVEGATWPYEVEVELKHPEGNVEYTFPAGTPFLGIIWEPWAWNLIKAGEIRGLSIGGTAQRTELELSKLDYAPTGSVEFTKEKPSVGDFVSWNSSGGRARGKIERIVRDGDIKVPNSSLTISGAEDDPAVLITVWREFADGWKATDTKVGHKLGTLTRISSLNKQAPFIAAPDYSEPVEFAKMIHEIDGKYHLFSQDGKTHLGEFPTLAAAEKREAEINRIKHMVNKTLYETIPLLFIDTNDLIGKHLSGRHDQSSHARGSGKYPRVPDKPAASKRSPEAVALAIGIRGAANKRSDAITDDMTKIASELGGELTGLQSRLKSTDSLARKIDEDAEKEYNGDKNLAASKISDASRYTMVLDDKNYTNGVADLQSKLEAEGYDVRTKNFWKEGDPYQGVNIKLTKDGVITELQVHTPKSVQVKSTLLHPIYENFRESTDTGTRRSLYDQMVGIAATIPKPDDYDTLLSLGIPAFQQFTG